MKFIADLVTYNIDEDVRIIPYVCPICMNLNLIKPVLKFYPCFNDLSSIEKLKLLMQQYQLDIKQALDIKQQSLHSCYL